MPLSKIVQDSVNGGVASTGPAFFAYKTGQQTGISYNTWTKVQFNLELFDTAGAFDTATNYRFQPLVAGYYQINANVYVNTGSTGGQQCAIYKTSGAYCYGSSSTAASTDSLSVASTVLYLNGSTDYVEVYVYSTGTSGTFQTNGGGGGGLVSFSGALVRAA